MELLGDAVLDDEADCVNVKDVVTDGVVLFVLDDDSVTEAL